MVTPMGQKKLRVYDGTPVGQVIQSPINLETMTNGQWIALDGRDCIRSQYPELSPYFPAGVFTSTARTISDAPVSPTCASDTTNFLMGTSGGGTSALQASPDGISWYSSGTWGASTAVYSLVTAGSRFVIAGSAGDLTQPYVSTTNQVAATQVTKAAWTVTTGGTTPTTALKNGLAYGSTANAGAGRTVLCRDSSLTTAAGLFYMNDGATAWNAASGGSTCTRVGVCWTGQRFVAITNSSLYQTSSDGATWSDNYMPYMMAPTGSVYMASDGNGTIVIAGVTLDGAGTPGNYNTFGLLVSKDHGLSWRSVTMQGDGGWYGIVGSLIGFVSFLNGKFLVTQNAKPYGTWISSDGQNWQWEPVGLRGVLMTTVGLGVGYKAGVYNFFNVANTGSFTSVEDMSKFRIPSARIAGPSAVPAAISHSYSQTYIKARSN